jgi:integrase
MPRTKRPQRSKGQGNLLKDRRSRYLQLSYWNGHRQVRQSARTEDRADAFQILRERLSSVHVFSWGSSAEQVKVNGLFQLLLDDYRRQARTDLYQAELRIAKHFRPVFGEMRAAKLGSHDIRQYIDTRSAAGASYGTINRELSLLRRAFNLGTYEDPPLVLRAPRIPKLAESNARQGFLEPEQYQSILESPREPLKPVFVVAYHLGMRKGELLKLRRDWVDLDEGLIFVEGRVTKNRKPKTAPIYGDMRPWLEKQLARPGKYLFTWEEGKPIYDFRTPWWDACAAVGCRTCSSITFAAPRRAI